MSISPPSYNPDEIITTSPNALNLNDVLLLLPDVVENPREEPENGIVDLSDQVSEPLLPPNIQSDDNKTDPPECISKPQSIRDVQPNIDPMSSTSSYHDSPVDVYPTFPKAMANKYNSFNTNIEEHNGSLIRCSTKIVLVPTSIDLDESNLYIQEILNDTETLNNIQNVEKELFSFHKGESSNKIYYLLFMKVHHFDESSHP